MECGRCTFGKLIWGLVDTLAMYHVRCQTLRLMGYCVLIRLPRLTARLAALVGFSKIVPPNGLYIITMALFVLLWCKGREL